MDQSHDGELAAGRATATTPLFRCLMCRNRGGTAAEGLSGRRSSAESGTEQVADAVGDSETT
jgi:hypothetical protein